MKIKPDSWQFIPSTICCGDFKMQVFDEIGMPEITTNGTDVFFSGNKITHCPYCGKEIKLEKVK